jgi:hypothetical protein
MLNCTALFSAACFSILSCAFSRNSSCYSSDSSWMISWLVISTRISLQYFSYNANADLLIAGFRQISRLNAISSIAVKSAGGSITRSLIPVKNAALASAQPFINMFGYRIIKNCTTHSFCFCLLYFEPFTDFYPCCYFIAIECNFFNAYQKNIALNTQHQSTSGRHRSSYKRHSQTRPRFIFCI